MSELLGNKKEVLRILLKDLHQGLDPQEAGKKFTEALQDTTSADISRIEEELVQEGVPREETQKLHHYHRLAHSGPLKTGKPLAAEGHPIHILMEEHKMLEDFARELLETSGRIKDAAGYEAAEEHVKQYRHIVQHFKRSESHYVREENVLFPYLERHGINQPPAQMWTEHNQIRDTEKALFSLNEGMSFSDFSQGLSRVAHALEEMLPAHFYKENSILFPAALRVIGEGEWREIRSQFDDLGYCCFTPEGAMAPLTGGPDPEPQPLGAPGGDDISFEAGALNKLELETLLNTLPVDMTFVDAKDRVRYFSQGTERIFPRTKAIIGRKVQQCHPRQSMHVVEKILKDFKEKLRDTAEFWINLNGRFIYIRYFAVRGPGEEYLGCLEVTQDITDIRAMDGEKRLLD